MVVLCVCVIVPAFFFICQMNGMGRDTQTILQVEHGVNQDQFVVLFEGCDMNRNFFDASGL